MGTFNHMKFMAIAIYLRTCNSPDRPHGLESGRAPDEPLHVSNLRFACINVNTRTTNLLFVITSLIDRFSTRSIATDAMLRLGIRVALVIVAATTITYFHVINVVESQTMDHLQKYADERAKVESAIFQFVKDGHQSVKEKLLSRLSELGGSDPRARFYREVVRFPDGVTRTRLQGFNGKKESFIYIGKQVRINAEVRRKVMVFLDLSNQFGPAWHHRLEDFYFTTPDNILVGYWPAFPTWAHEASADLYMPDEEYVYVADARHNPQRQTVWTGLYYDEPSNAWLVSTETPVDLDGRQIATIGSDITLNTLMDRTINNHLQGTYNMIIRKDGRLIAHPDLMSDIKARKGRYDIGTSGSPYLKTVFELVSRRKDGSPILRNDSFDEILAVQELDGPGWYFITVYPESLVQDAADSTARVVLFAGAFSLVLELLFLYWVLGNRVSRPLSGLVTAVNKVADGDHDIVLNPGRKDELGRISNAFLDMARKIESRTRDLEQARNQLEEKVAERTRSLEEAHDALLKKERLATLGQLTATVSHELRNPLAAIMSSLYLLKRDDVEDEDIIRRSIERIERNAIRCDHIIDELLDFTRATDIKLQQINIDAWLEQVLEEIDIPEDVEVRKDLASGDTPTDFDPDRMRRAVINVVTNACQAMAVQDGSQTIKPGATLQVRTRTDGQRVTILVVDNGRGMEPEVREKMFEPLFSTKGFGIGLGMSVIKAVMDQHHGGVDVCSSPESGTRVELWIPRSGNGHAT